MNVRALQTKLKIVEVPSFEDKRRYGSSRLRTIPDGWRVLKIIFREWLASQRRATKVLPPKTAPAPLITSASDAMALSSRVEAETS
jgi:hypothetical protein